MPSRKAILNVSSVKHKDTMLPLDLSAIVGPRLVAHNDIILWCATARPLAYSNLSTNVVGSVPLTASRNSQEVFLRGLKERIQITTSTATAWFWRRVCFARKGQFANTLIDLTHYVSLTSPSSTSQLQYQVNRNTETLAPLERSALVTYLFEGQYGIDWYSYINASLDSKNVRVIFDHTTTINSGNQQGVTRMFSRWHSMNKTMRYNDRETGSDILEQQVFASPGISGMGDYYVVDFFQNSVPNGDTLSFGPEARLYWHER